MRRCGEGEEMGDGQRDRGESRVKVDPEESREAEEITEKKR